MFFFVKECLVYYTTDGTSPPTDHLRNSELFRPLAAQILHDSFAFQVVSEGEFKLRMSNEFADDTHHYCMHMDGGIVIDGHRMGGECRFVNHSCQPNCEMQKW